MPNICYECGKFKPCKRVWNPLFWLTPCSICNISYKICKDCNDYSDDMIKKYYEEKRKEKLKEKANEEKRMKAFIIKRDKVLKKIRGNK